MDRHYRSLTKRNFIYQLVHEYNAHRMVKNAAKYCIPYINRRFYGGGQIIQQYVSNQR